MDGPVPARGGFFEPLVALTYPLPKVAINPLTMIWFGIGHFAKILIVFVGCLMPVVIHAYNGARGLDHLLVWFPRAMGAGGRGFLRKVALSATIPALFRGLRVAHPPSPILVFASETVAGGGGLGFLRINALRSFEIPTCFAALFAVLLIALGLDRIRLWGRRRWLRWHEASAAAHAGKA